MSRFMRLEFCDEPYIDDDIGLSNVLDLHA
jgi:hypothetical protein